MSRSAPQARLDKLLANLGYGSRKEIAVLARAGAIRLDGKPVMSADQRLALTPELQAGLTIRGKTVDPLPGMAVMLNKPLGVTCSHKEAGALVYDLLPARWRRRDPALSTVGRLDKDTSGLLLLTDDGALLHRIISPRSHLEKRYRASLARPLRGDEGQAFTSGTLVLEGDDKPLLPATLEPLSPTEALLTITEGRYHQVRRMFAAVGNHVEALHRERVGGLGLPPELEPGAWRLMTGADIEALFGAA
jgi:16S rRNA pseudouridine516 synthase